MTLHQEKASVNIFGNFGIILIVLTAVSGFACPWRFPQLKNRRKSNFSKNDRKSLVALAAHHLCQRKTFFIRGFMCIICEKTEVLGPLQLEIGVSKEANRGVPENRRLG